MNYSFYLKFFVATALAAGIAMQGVAENIDDGEDVIVIDDTQTGNTVDEGVRKSANESADSGLNPEDKVSVAAGQSVLEAVNSIAGQMRPVRSLRTDLLTELEFEKLKTVTNEFSTGSISMSWSKVLDEILGPWDIAYFEDGDQIAIGSQEAMDTLAKSQAIRELANNHRRIAPDFSGGVDINTALRTIRALAGIKLNFDYMENEFRAIKPVVDPEEGKSEAEKAPVNVQPPQQQRMTTFSVPNDHPVEWRDVLREVLDPIDYKFVEDGGVVRPMPKAKYNQYLQDKINAKPLVTKVIRIHHAKPETIAKQLNEMKITKHGSAYIKITQPDTDKTKTYSGGAAGMSTPSGTRVGASSVGSASFGNLERPRTPPAIVIADIEDNIPVIEERVKLLDVKEKQILIEALVLNVDDNTSDQLGIQWSGLDNVKLINATWQKGRNRNKMDVRINNKTANDAYDGVFLSSSKSYSSNGSEQDHIVGSEWSKSRESNSEFTETRNRDAWGQGKYDVGNNGLSTSFGSGFSKVSERVNKTLFSGLLGPIDLAATLSLVEECGKDQVLSSPVLVMGDHTESIIQVGEAHPIAIVRNTYVQDRSDTAQEVEWQIVMSGVTLWVSPEVTEDGESVRLSVHPQITKVTGWEEYDSPQLGYMKYPTIQSRELDTRVTVPTGDTLILGGLIENEQSVKKGKIWLLGDIPLLGRLFRWETTSEERKNLMILIRPTILDDDDPETKFDSPALKVIEPTLERNMDLVLGRNEPEDKMREREKKILRIFSRDKDGNVTEVTDGELAATDEISSTPPSEEKNDAQEEAPVVIQE